MIQEEKLFLLAFLATRFGIKIMASFHLPLITLFEINFSKLNEALIILLIICTFYFLYLLFSTTKAQSIVVKCMMLCF